MGAVPGEIHLVERGEPLLVGGNFELRARDVDEARRILKALDFDASRKAMAPGKILGFRTTANDLLRPELGVQQQCARGRHVFARERAPARGR